MDEEEHFITLLPIELLPSIFSHLDSKDLLSVSLTCSHWCDLAKQSSVWELPYFRRFGPFKSDIAAVLIEGLHWKSQYRERLMLEKETDNDIVKIRHLVKEKAVKPRSPNLLLWARLFEGYSRLEIKKLAAEVAWRYVTKECIAPNIYFLDLVDLGVALCQANLARKAEYVLKKALDFSPQVDSAVLMNINNLACAVLMMAALPYNKPEKRDQYFSQAEELFLRLPEEHETKYSNLACVYSISKQFEKCQAAIERAIADERIASDYMESEPDFDNVRELPWWSAALRKLREQEQHKPPPMEIDLATLLQELAPAGLPAVPGPPVPLAIAPLPHPVYDNAADEEEDHEEEEDIA